MNNAKIFKYRPPREEDPEIKIKYDWEDFDKEILGDLSLEEAVEIMKHKLQNERIYTEMTINEYQKEALRTAQTDKLNPEERLLNGVMGLNGEAGEAIDIVKKHIFQGHDLDVEHVAKELGDIAWYLATSADAIDYDLETIFRMNVEKLRDRYPEGFDPEKSQHRKTEDI